MCKYPTGVSKEDGARLLSVVLSGKTQQIEIEEIPFKYNKYLPCCKGALTLEHISHGGCDISSIKGIHHQTRHGPDQPALAGPVLNRGLGLKEIQRSLPNLTVP